MAYTPTVWTNEVPDSTPLKYQIVDDALGSIAASAQILLITSVTAGTPVNATNLNKLENGVKDAQDDATQGIADAAAAQVSADEGIADAAAAQATADAAIPKSLVTAAGDMIRATGSGVPVRLPIGSAGQFLRVAAGVPTWVTPFATGISANISTDTTSTTYIDVPNSTINLTLSVTSTVLLLAVLTGTSRNADSLVVRGNIGGTDGQEVLLCDNKSDTTIDAPVFIMQRKTGVAAGTVTLKLLFKSLAGAQVNLYNGNVFAIALPE